MRLFRTASAPSKHSRSGEDSAALSDERARATRLEAENKALRDEVALLPMMMKRTKRTAGSRMAGYPDGDSRNK